MAPYVGCCIEGPDDGVPFLELSIANGTGRENWISVALAWLAEREELGSNVLHAAAESAAYSQELGGSSGALISFNSISLLVQAHGLYQPSDWVTLGGFPNRR